MSAIHKIKDIPCKLALIHDRCREVDDCWIWAKGTKHGSLPRIWLRREGMDGVVRDYEVFVRHLVMWINTGERPPVGAFNVVLPTCGNDLCVNPKHLKLFTKAEANSRFSTMGHLQNRVKVAKARRRNAKLTDEQVRQIRESDAPQKELAPMYGVSQQYISLIQKGISRMEYVNPFAGLGA